MNVIGRCDVMKRLTELSDEEFAKLRPGTELVCIDGDAAWLVKGNKYKFKGVYGNRVEVEELDGFAFFKKRFALIGNTKQYKNRKITNY